MDDLVDLDHLGHSFFLGLWHVGIIVLRLFIDFGDLDFVGFQLDFLDLNLFRFGKKHDKLRLESYACPQSPRNEQKGSI